MGFKNQSGVTYIEAAIVLPVFFLLVIGFIDLCIYFGAQALMDVAASKAASVASVNPGLDSEVQADRTSAVANIRSAALEFGADTVVADEGTSELMSFYIPASGESPATNPVANVPLASNNTSSVHINMPLDYSDSAVQPRLNTNPSFLRDSLADQPIEIKVHGEVQTILLGYFIGDNGRIKTTGRAIAYRQTVETPAAAPLVECGGEENRNGDGTCQCGEESLGMIRDELTGVCICPGDLIRGPDGCQCPSRTELRAGNRCVYDGSCPRGTLWDEESMLCEAPTCVGNNRILDADTGACVCDPDACTGLGDDLVLDPATCQCVECRGDRYADLSNRICHRCDEREEFDELDCGDGMFPDPESCRCSSCGSGTFERVVGLECVCDTTSLSNASATRGRFQFFNFTSCQNEDCPRGLEGSADGRTCVCPGAETGIADCRGRGPEFIYLAQIDSGFCGCVDCSENDLVANSAGTACVCPAEPETPCDEDEFYNPLTCECEENDDCEDDRMFNGSGECVCREDGRDTCNRDEYWDEERCRCRNCPGDQISSDDRTFCFDCEDMENREVNRDGYCVCDDDDRCGGNMYRDPYTCECLECPSGKVPSIDGFSCECSRETERDCEGFNEETCTCPVCPTGTMFTSAEFEYCCRDPYVGIQRVNICEPAHRYYYETRSTRDGVERVRRTRGWGEIFRICRNPVTRARYDRWVCSRCDGGACDRTVSVECVQGIGECSVNPIE